MRLLPSSLLMLFAAAGAGCSWPGDHWAATDSQPLATAVAVTVDGCGDAGSACNPQCATSGRFLATDDVVFDTATGGRAWERNPPDTLVDLATAQHYCASLTLADEGGYRLPTVAEFKAIQVEPGGLSDSADVCIPAIDQAAFPGTKPEPYWTSTRTAQQSALYTGFDDGRSHPATDDSLFRVRCTRDL